MAFTEEQEEVLKRMIKAFQNGKTISDLPRFTTSGDSAYNLPIETIMPVSGRSGCIRAGVLNDALNAEEKKRVNTEINGLQRRAEYLERPHICIETNRCYIKINNARWYEENGYGLYFFRNIKATNNKTNELLEGHSYNYLSCWKPKGDRNSIQGRRDSYLILHTIDDDTVVKDGAVCTPDALLDCYTEVASNGKTYLRAQWGHRGKKIDITKTKATLTFECGFAYGPVWNEGETEMMRISDMVSNFVPFKIVIYYEPIEGGSWRTIFAI